MCDQQYQNDNMPYQLPYEECREKNERRQIKKTGSLIGLGIILMFVFQVIMVGAMTMFFSYLNGISFVGSIPVAVRLLLVQGIVSIVEMCVPFIIVMKMSGNTFSQLMPFKKVSAKKLILLLELGYAACLCASIATDQFMKFLEKIGITPHVPEIDVGRSPLEVFWGFLAVAVVPALVEEFAFRGVIMGMLRKFGDSFAILVSAAIFGLIHGNARQIPFAFVGGLVMGYFVIYTNSMLPSIVLHFFNNSISVIFKVLANNNVSQASLNTTEYVLLIIFLLLGILCYRSLAKHDDKFLHIEPSNSVFSLKRRFKYVTVNAGMLTALVLLVFVFIINSVM